jgi:AcrR family transcriptional regulator
MLISEQGYDETTVQEIAEAAGCSPRTFFRYFESKERVLFFGREDFIASLVDTYLQLPPDGTDLDRFSRAIVELAPSIEALGERIVRYQRAIASSAALRGDDRDRAAVGAATIAAANASNRTDPHPTASDQLLGEILLLLMQRALDEWINDGLRRPFARFYRAEYQRLKHLLDPVSPVA